MYSFIGVIGDVHLEYERLQKAINHLKKNHVEQIFCTGDVVNYNSATVHDFKLVEHCIKTIIENNIQTVLGNHDDWFQRNEIITSEAIFFIKNLPKQIEFKGRSSDVLFCHGIRSNYMAKINPDDFGYAIESNFELHAVKSKYSMLINGHSHRKMVRKIGNLTVINAGTLHRRDDPGFIQIDFEKNTVDFLEFDSENNIIQKESINWNAI